MAEFSRGTNHDKISHGHRLRMAGVHEVMVGFGESRILEGDMPTPIVDLYTAHEGRQTVDDIVMGFNMYGEFDVQHVPTLEIPGENWDSYLNQVNW